MRYAARDITGMRFGSLVAEELLLTRSIHGHRVWRCVCDCGRTTNVLQGSLTTGNSTKCDDHPKNNYRFSEDGLFVVLDVSTPSQPDAVSKIDTDDLERVINYRNHKGRMKWIAHDSSGKGALWGNYVSGSDRKTRLHRFILNLDDPVQIVDHINGDTLDNRKSNLRVITRRENNKNMRKRIDNSTGFTGVQRSRDGELFIAKIQLHHRVLQLGTFDTAHEAGIAYRAAARALEFSERHGT